MLIVSTPCFSSTSIKPGSFLKVQTDRLIDTGITGVLCPCVRPVLQLYLYQTGVLPEGTDRQVKGYRYTGVLCPPCAPGVPLANWGPS